MPHYFGFGMYIVKSRATAWQAQTTIESPIAQTMRLRLDCADAGQLWVNGHLVFRRNRKIFDCI